MKKPDQKLSLAMEDYLETIYAFSKKKDMHVMRRSQGHFLLKASRRTPVTC